MNGNAPPIRKDTISVKTDEKVIIPVNMGDGLIVGVGKSNPEWNDDGLRNVWVIIIMDYDPFAQDSIIYTIGKHIKEFPNLPYDDGERTILLYTKGQQEPRNVYDELRDLLRYMEDTADSNAVNDGGAQIRCSVFFCEISCLTLRMRVKTTVFIFDRHKQLCKTDKNRLYKWLMNRYNPTDCA